MQESCTYGSVRGAPSNGCPYRNREKKSRNLVSRWSSTELVWLRPPEGLGALAPRVEEFGDADARTSMQLWLELFPPTDIQGMLAAFAQRDLLLWRWCPKQGNEPTLQ
jgi:hypothetical protein